ncbi:MAG: GGDEF domain-containing protein [Rhodoferax sp.]|nr:GGDEF domain-containing protein [Rhodoferax sp.]
MDAFHWNPCFVTGLTDVDSQHHHLVDVINRFGELVMREKDASSDELETVFTELAAYSQYHFAEEEQLMADAHLDAHHIAHHVREHAQFLGDLNYMHAEIAAHKTGAASALLHYLSNWLAYHILGSDQLMAGAMRAIAKGVPAHEAYVSFNKDRDPATATLLHAMNRLIEQVSERNRALFELNQTLEARVAERTRALSELNAQLESMAMTDVLTGLPNRRQAMRILDREWKLSASTGAPLSCMMIDADGFKTINDNHGHDAGDTVLRALAHCLKESVRTDDVVCRLGGDEFLIICMDTALEGALTSAENVRRAVAALRVTAGSGVWPGSVSIGVAQALPGLRAKGLDAWLKLADDSVYAAKRNGRNCVAAVQGLAG